MTAQLRLAPPANIRAIVSQINAGLAGITANVTINTTGISSQLATLNRNLKGTSKAASSAANDMERFGEQAAIAIRRYGAFTLATTAFMKLTGAISSGIDEAIAFDRELVRIAQVTGHSVGGLKDLNDEVTRLSKEFGVSSTKILESSVTLAQAGLSARDVKIALEALAKTGVSATFGDIKNTTEASIAIMQQFGKEAKDLEGILGSINSVSAKFAVESEDIAVAVRRTGGAFAAAGGNLEEFQALFTSVRQTTRESAETIATGFRTIFTRIQRSRTQNFLQSLGIDLKDVEGQFVGPYEAIRRLSGALKDLKSTDPRFAQIIEELGGFRQISKVIPLITKFDVSQQALNVALRGGNSLSKDAETAQEALAIQLTKVKEEFLALIRVVTNNSAFRGMIDLTLKLSSTLIKLATTLEPILPLLATFGAAQAGASAGAFFTGFGRKIKGQAQGGPVHAFAKGGVVPGHGNGDTVAANLTPGEFVIRKDAVKAIGTDRLHQLNKFAKGGKAYTFPYPQRPNSAYGTGATLSSEITKQEKDSVRNYTEEGYIPINSHLKERGPEHPDARNHIKNLDSAISKSKFDKKTSYLLYRGIGKNRKDEISQQIGVDLGTKAATGKIYEDAGYVSTSQIKSKAATFGNHELTIKTKPGANGLDVFDSSANRFEKEILLPRNSRFKILEAEPHDSVVQQLNGGGFVFDGKKSYYNGTEFTTKKLFGSSYNKGKAQALNVVLKGSQSLEDKEKYLDGLIPNWRANISAGAAKTTAAKKAAKEEAKSNSVVNVTGVPNLITGDPKVTGVSQQPLGKGKGVSLSTLLTNASKSDIAKITDPKKGFAPDTTFVGSMNIHGLRPELSENFGSNVETALSQAARQIVSQSPIKDFAPGASNDRNITSLVSYSAVQSMKGNLLEAFARIVTGSSISTDAKDARIDFSESDSTNLGKIFDGKISGPSEAKINASSRSQNSVLLKGLAEGVTKKFANGGHATGTDTVPAMLTPGEFVINKQAAASLGPSTLRQLNNADKVQKYAAGGHVQRFAAGGSPTSLGSVASNPLALVGIISSLGALSSQFIKADTVVGQFVDVLQSVGFQFTIFKSVLAGIKPNIAHKSPLGDTRDVDSIRDDTVADVQRARAEKNRATGLSEERIQKRNAARLERDTKSAEVSAKSKFNSTGNKFARGLSTTAILGGVASQVGGGFLAERGQKQIAEGNKAGIGNAFAGDVIAGAGTGAAIGAMFGPLGAAVGAVTGGIISWHSALGKYEKQLDNVQFAKKMETFSRTVDRYSSGKLSLKEARGSIISGVSDVRKKAVGDEAKDIKAKFGTDSGKVEKFIDDITKDAKSFAELETSTGNLINHFSILTDIPYATLKEQIEKQIVVYQKSSDTINKLDKLKAEETRSVIVLAAMNTAINEVSSSFESFDAQLSNSAGFLSGRGASFQAKDFSSILEKVGTGKFNNSAVLKQLGNEVTGSFGTAGSQQVDKLTDVSKALSELPSLLLEIKNQDPLGTQRNFTERLTKALGGRFSAETIGSISGGVDKFIGAEDKDEKIITAINDNLQSVVAEVGKSLQNTVDMFKEFAPAFQKQAERIRSAFDLYTDAQIKVADYEQSIARNSESSINLGFEARGKVRPASDVRSGELNRIGLLTGGVTDSRVLEARLIAARKTASDISERASKTLNVSPSKDGKDSLSSLNTDLSKANLEIKNTTKALEELASSSEGLNAIQKELAIAEENRKFKENLTLTAIFGSKEAKQDLSNKIGFTAIATQQGLDAVPEKERAGVLEFLQSAAQGKQKINGIDAEELIRIISERSRAGQQIGSALVRSNLTQGDNPKAANLTKQAQDLIAAQSDALKALSNNAKAIGDEAALAIGNQNEKFLNDLRAIFIEKLIGEKTQAIGGKESELALAKAKKTAVKFLSGEIGVDINDTNIRDVQPAVDKLKSLKAAQIEKQKLNTVNKEGIGFKLDSRDTELGAVLNKIKDDANKAGLDFNDKDLERISNITVKDTTLKSKGFGFGTPAQTLRDKLTDNTPLSPQEIEKFNKALQDFIIERNKEKTDKNKTDISNLIRDLTISGTEIGKSIAKELTNVGLNDTNELESVITALETNLKNLGTESIDKLTPSIDLLTNQIVILNRDKGKLQEALKDKTVPIPTPPEIPLGRAMGGGVPGVGNSDTVPAMLTPGEFVIRKSAVESIGLDTLHAMNNGYNRGGTVQRFAKGGAVRYFSDGAGGEPENEAQKKKREAEEEAEELRRNRSAYNSLHEGGSYGFTSISQAENTEHDLRARGKAFAERDNYQGAIPFDLQAANQLRDVIKRANKHEQFLNEQREFLPNTPATPKPAIVAPILPAQAKPVASVASAGPISQVEPPADESTTVPYLRRMPVVTIKPPEVKIKPNTAANDEIHRRALEFQTIENDYRNRNSKKPEVKSVVPPATAMPEEPHAVPKSDKSFKPLLREPSGPYDPVKYRRDLLNNMREDKNKPYTGNLSNYNTSPLMSNDFPKEFAERADRANGDLNKLHGRIDKLDNDDSKLTIRPPVGSPLVTAGRYKGLNARYDVQTRVDADKKAADAQALHDKQYARKQAAHETYAAAKLAERERSANAFTNVQASRGQQSDFQKAQGAKADDITGIKPAITNEAKINQLKGQVSGQQIVTTTHAQKPESTTKPGEMTSKRVEFLRGKLSETSAPQGRTRYGAAHSEQLLEEQFEYRKELGALLRVQAGANRGQKATKTTIHPKEKALINPEEEAFQKERHLKILEVNKKAAERRAEDAKFDKEIAKRRNLERRTGSRLTKNERIKKSNEQYLDGILTGDPRYDDPLKKKASRKGFQARGGFGGTQRFAEGGRVDGGGGGGFGINIKGITDGIGSVVKTFSTVVDNMASKLSEFKDFNMTITATHRVEVIHNGAEVLAQMDEKFKELAMGQAVTAINEMIDKKFPDAGRFTRGS